MANHQLFRYPPMERQDLNQSQLGSFKFTPVDPVNNMQSLTQTAGQILQQQLSQRQRIPEASTSSAGVSRDDRSTLSSGRAPPQLKPSGNTDYFNEHIKPDLGDSRLRLGPAVLRTAVDGGSPAKKFTYMEPDFNVKRSRPNSSVNPPQVISPQFRANIMDPTAATFMPTPDLFSAGISDSASVSGTLCNALANEQRAHATEQRAHAATKTDLAQQVRICTEQAEQMEAYERKVAHMQTEIDILRAIVKHNANQQNSDEMKSNKETGYSEDAVDPGLNKFYRETRKLKKTGNHEERTKEAQVDHADPLQDKTSTKQGAAGTVAAASANEVIDDARLYDLDLLQKSDTGNSVDSVWRRTLRKHFSIESSADDGQALETPPTKRGSLYNLIDVSPESVDGVTDLMGPQVPASVTSVNGGLTPTQDRLLDTINPTVNSVDVTVSVFHQADVTGCHQSEEIVAKCGNKSAPAPLEQKSNGADLKMQHLKNLQSLRIGPEAELPPQDENDGRLTPVSSAFDGDGRATTDVVSSTDQPTKDRIIFKIDSDLHGVTKWQINKDNPIFEDDQEKWECVRVNGPAFRNSSQFFDHPVRYLPEDAAATADAYRTVMIDGIPTGSAVTDVLSIVKGGSVEKIQLFPPIGDSMPSMTARVVFIFERSAHNMIKHQEANPGQDAEINRFKIKGANVRCWMPSDPTYPRNHAVDREIFGELRATRIVVVGHVDEYTFNMIPYRIKAPDDQHIIAYTYTAEGNAELEFGDIETAIKVKNELDIAEGLWGSRIQYVDDYTCVPYVHGEPMGD